MLAGSCRESPRSVHLFDQIFGDERGRGPTIRGGIQVDPDHDRHVVLGVGASEGIEARNFTGMPIQRTEFRDSQPVLWRIGLCRIPWYTDWAMRLACMSGSSSFPSANASTQVARSATVEMPAPAPQAHDGFKDV